MAGAFLLPALSPEDGIPVVQAGSCSAALHCDEFSTDVFLLSLLSALPVLVFFPACLQPWSSHFLNMSSTFVLLFPILLLNLSALFLDVFPLCVHVCMRVCTSVLTTTYFTIPVTKIQIWIQIISKTAVKMEKGITTHFQVG